MGYFKTKYEKDSARITALLALILLLLIFIIGPKYMDPPEEYGVAINISTTDFGSGQVQPQDVSESKEVVEEEIVEEDDVEDDVVEELIEEATADESEAEKAEKLIEEKHY